MIESGPSIFATPIYWNILVGWFALLPLARVRGEHRLTQLVGLLLGIALGGAWTGWWAWSWMGAAIGGVLVAYTRFPGNDAMATILLGGLIGPAPVVASLGVTFLLTSTTGWKSEWKSEFPDGKPWLYWLHDGTFYISCLVLTAIFVWHISTGQEINF